MGSRNSIHPSLSGQSSACVNDISNVETVTRRKTRRLFGNIISLHFDLSLSFEHLDKSFIRLQSNLHWHKTPIFEWEVAILFTFLWVDKVTLQFVIGLQTLGWELYLMTKATFIYFKNIFFFVMYYQKTATLGSLSFFRTRLLQYTRAYYRGTQG